MSRAPRLVLAVILTLATAAAVALALGTSPAAGDKEGFYRLVGGPGFVANGPWPVVEEEADALSVPVPSAVLFMPRE